MSLIIIKDLDVMVPANSAIEIVRYLDDLY